MDCDFRSGGIPVIGDPHRHGGSLRFERITVDPKQMGGIPCIRGLRIPAAAIVHMVAERMTDAEIVGAYPDLEPEPRSPVRSERGHDTDSWTRRAYRGLAVFLVFFAVCLFLPALTVAW